MSSTIRLITSAVISFIFYFVWTYWANDMVSDDQSLVLRSALVQASLSATITILFTFALEKSVSRFGGNSLSLIFVVPLICSMRSKTTQNIAVFKTINTVLETSARYLSGTKLPGTMLAPLLPITVQSSITIGVNVINQTPNLWLTVAPSILITAIYGYIYTFTLLSKPKQPVLSES